MRVRCVRAFRDFEAGALRKVGDAFEVSPERFRDINSAGYGQLVQEVVERPSEAVSEPRGATSSATKATPKRRTRTRKTAE